MLLWSIPRQRMQHLRTVLLVACLWLFSSNAVALSPASFSSVQTAAKHQPLTFLPPAASINRRKAIFTATAAASSIAAALSFPRSSQAADIDTDAKLDQPQLLTVANLLSSLRSVPLFCIVSSDGAAYMLYNKGTMAKGYAFTTLSAALAVLKDAQNTAEKGGYAETWQGATITTIPADVAIRLSLQPAKRTSQKESLEAQISSIVEIIPGAKEREDAIKMESTFKTQGKVPLFYSNALQVTDQSSGVITLPMYFSKDDLLQEWIKRNPEKPLPSSGVLELSTLFQYVLRKRANELPIGVNKKLLFVPSAEAVEAATELKSKGLAPYKLDRMIV